MIGLNKNILHSYIEYLTNNRMQNVGLPPCFQDDKGVLPSNPIPWISSWLQSDNVQVAPQEVEIASYLMGQIDADVGSFEGMEL